LYWQIGREILSRQEQRGWGVKVIAQLSKDLVQEFPEMNLFIAAVDEQERKPGDQPTIGIILCKTKNKTIAEYAIRNLRNPIAVAEHRLPKLLPTPEQLELELENAAQQIEAEEDT
jgi:hypothetical protein